MYFSLNKILTIILKCWTVGWMVILNKTDFLDRLQYWFPGASLTVVRFWWTWRSCFYWIRQLRFYWRDLHTATDPWSPLLLLTHRLLPIGSASDLMGSYIWVTLFQSYLTGKHIKIFQRTLRNTIYKCTTYFPFSPNTCFYDIHPLNCVYLTQTTTPWPFVDAWS